MPDPVITHECEKRLSAMGLTLPIARPPVGNFVPARQQGRLLYLSGQGPVAEGGKRTGKVGQDVDTERAYDDAKLTGLNLLAQAKLALGTLDRVTGVVKLLGFVNATTEFTEHPKVINGCSDLLVAVFGDTAGRHARSAIGVGSLPGQITVEIEAIFSVR
ncbi:enamine deaminase RidA (YjgF/YER057c/UK114 family) [Bosea sp. BE271]|uniref:RidA family protein n=1 Tax=Bosea TaxID=85413 RepID=UPI0028567E22|nr:MULTISPECIES: RidA family protein [Bosea]MDR6827668.1 enamine deaminase RidA (YjgF/YER057c/UK114 family) [Bosea robiniae]MDR6894638.1 enamine deaminase RidA (YjgF/YER057c/UK114 family) [Bosea sp. BE109]MDR7137774.1 enamine deaminase RidA (YjgF/YER057c/UK114 family) [Bosea sp. BE168]MDR7174473.1 enamine deaminase RidA (YjgF/YER057c/UK114 family) [Bosea sp. BE271]